MMQHNATVDMAPSGIASMPSVSWGSHICQLFDTADHLRNVLVPYFKAGLENNERCLWVADAPFGAEEARSALRNVLPDLDRRERNGQIEIRDTDAFYDRAQPLQSKEIVSGLLRREEDALAVGYRGLRTNGNCAWVGEATFLSFLDYESAVHKAISGRRMICMCSYSHGCLDSLEASEVLERHDIVLPSPRARSRQNPTGDDVSLSNLSDRAIAILGHDLRNPLAAISAGTTLLRRRDEDEARLAIVDGIEKSAMHMMAFVNDILDVSRSRLGQGLSVRPTRAGLLEALTHAVEEIRLVHPDREIVEDIALDGSVEADPVYMARLLSNLLKNAMTYGSKSDPVLVRISIDRGLVLSVANKGEPIPEHVRAKLFSPFVRGSSGDRNGLGLGLYIVAEISRAHGATIDVASDEHETRFTFRLPAAAPPRLDG